MDSKNKQEGMSRRDFLKISASVGVGLAIGASGMAAIENAVAPADKTANGSGYEPTDERIPMYGEHQAGIITPQQTYMYLASFRLTVTDRDALIKVLRDWTKFSDLSTAGGTMRTGDNPLLPPSDTGETLDLPASKLTVTFGFGPTFFSLDGKDRFGIAHKIPRFLKDIPRMPSDNLDPLMSGGDICIQVCAEDQQVAFHALRNFIRLSMGSATLNWMQEGFISGGQSGQTPRNLFGFKDGTANALHQTPDGYKDVVWAGEDEPDWMRGGTYMAYRKVRMFLEVWDRSSLSDQEDTFGRYKESGAAYGKKGEFDTPDPAQMPIASHVRLAKESKQLIHRRGYSYTAGVDPRTGNVDAGLLFISYQRNPEEQLLPMLKLMQSKDALNEYVSHVASGLFACPGGLREGQYIGQTILES
ncbi:iron uptake transporter deferrochelatase/peroxidase subunit [Cohnella cholangitidis]|uniref:Deferrochelatase n=1 Tax=Cohnella cholangitidis TaxID=2598458 RepID=A0A7G5C4G4_9BACL|nr:iron uptake transporter deferrochelatase/peroxidase subunit [Cohnella cholangitidis]QMV44098.1 deferrochelatase/peroxidase EfeB [Cohnella cholangitidis]